MECNRDEALRAKEISEAKLAENDFVGAKKFAQKAEKLFPGLEGLSQLSRIIDVYVISEKKINGESDWYSVLGVGPTANDETIAKNYRKLALSLHPDKNKSIGAEGAFKFVSQAWMLLSDKIKRKMYDQKLNARPVYQKPTETQKPSTFSNEHIQLIPRPPNAKTFWTACTRCRMHFEYAEVYRNQKLLCPNCQEPFWALGVPAPSMNHNSTKLHSQSQNLNASHQVNIQQGSSLNSSTVNHVNVQHGPTLNKGAVNTSGQLKQNGVKVGAMGQQTSSSGLGSVKGDAISKRRRVAEQSSMLNAHNVNAKVSVSSNIKLNNSKRELSQADIRAMLITKARKEIHKKLDEWNASKVSKKVGSKREGKISDSGRKDAEENIVNDMSKVIDVKTPLIDTMNTVDMDSDVKEAEATLMSVPDSDFRDFDMDRTESSFGENQIWAAYDDDDGMPRYYAMIHSVISRRPFKMQISWLNSKSNAELGPIDWVSSGFSKTSGDFRIGKHVISTSLNSFSHKVQWTKGKKGAIQIYPQKGDVWAVYRNWSPGWNMLTPDEVIHKYDVVVIVEDYNEEKGVIVAPLVKVAGFKSVFHQHADVAEARMIPREEIFRLSHQVPFYMLTGEEALNVPKGCRELDPAALPMELLQTTIEPKVKAVEAANFKRTEVKGIITYSRKKEGKISETSRTSKLIEESKVDGFRK